LSRQDRLFIISGSLAPCGHAGRGAWTYDFQSGRWELLSPDSPVRGYGIMAVYDEASDLVYIKDADNFYAYSPSSNRYRKLNRGPQKVDYHLAAAIDTKRRLFVMVGNGVQVIDLDGYRMTEMTTIDTPSIVTGKQSPGVGYDPIADRIVVWHGGAEVYALNMDTRRWTQVATGKGPSFPAPYQGTFGRWGYVPKHGVFVVVNDIDQNGWLFKVAP
jgi:hypothetical protein